MGRYKGWKSSSGTSRYGREEEKKKKGGGGGPRQERRRARRPSRQVRAQEVRSRTTFQPGEVVEGFIGIDGGSTSTKAVLISKDKERRILAKAYQLSKGNPIEDTMEIFAKLEAADHEPGRHDEGVGRGHHRLRQGHSARTWSAPMRRWWKPLRTRKRACTSMTTSM